MNSFEVESIEETNQLASQLCRVLEAGDLVILKGNLGSGKTHFVKACLDYFQYNETVSSPTFTIANFYQTPQILVIHADLYRLKSANEYHALGLEDFMHEAINFIEWGDKFIDFFEDYLLVNFELVEGKPNARKIHLTTQNKDLEKRINSLSC